MISMLFSSNAAQIVGSNYQAEIPVRVNFGSLTNH